jgi:sortase A
MLARAQAAVEGVWGRPFRLRLSPRTGGFVGGLALLIGFVLMADALVTVVWQDPITAVFAQREQKSLGRKLDAAEKTPLPASTLALVRKAGSDRQRMALLAGNLRGRTPAGDPLGRIAIPRMHANFVFVAGTGESSLKKGPGHYASTVLPGERGTVALAGHRTTYLAPFRRLNRLRRGDAITFTMAYGRFSYRVEGSRVVSPSNTRVLLRAPYDRVVLTTCHPMYSAKKRLIATARLERATPRGPAIQLTPVPPRRITVGS